MTTRVAFETDPVAQRSVSPTSVGEWMLTLFLTMIPLVGQIMLLVWAFGGGAAPSKANWAKAALLWMVITVVLYVFIFMFVMAMIAVAPQ